MKEGKTILEEEERLTRQLEQSIGDQIAMQIFTNRATNKIRNKAVLRIGVWDNINKLIAT